MRIQWSKPHPKVAGHHPKLKTPHDWLKKFGPDHTADELKLLWEAMTGTEIGPSVMQRARDRLNVELGPIGWEKVNQKMRMLHTPPAIEGVDDLKLIEELQKRGYAAVAQTPIKVDQRIKVPIDRFDGDDYIFGLVTDSHLGSQYQQLTHLRSFYGLCEQEGIRDVYHAGDMSDGQNVYRGHRYEIFIHGADAQRDYTKEVYPAYDGCTTHIIGGNHDEDHWKRAGSEILKDIAEDRKDIKYYGFHGAFVDVGPISAYLAHGAGGVAYARSYKMQKFLNEIAPEHKPDLLFMGHYHTPCHLPQYRNVEAFMLPCFQSQTPYLKKKGLFPAIGGMIIKIRLNDFDRKDGIVMVEPKYVPFYRPHEKDW